MGQTASHTDVLLTWRKLHPTKILCHSPQDYLHKRRGLKRNQRNQKTNLTAQMYSVSQLQLVSLTTVSSIRPERGWGYCAGEERVLDSLQGHRMLPSSDNSSSYFVHMYVCYPVLPVLSPGFNPYIGRGKWEPVYTCFCSACFKNIEHCYLQSLIALKEMEVKNTKPC